MGEVAILVEGLGKQYRIGSRQAPYRTLRETIVGLVSAPTRAIGRPSRNAGGSADAVIWALRDVSFSVNEGEVVGVIGRNGAGKSTLLKVMSRITKPTRGRIVVNGRVGSLLEVGTGFHPELTGRENIYLNGAILGMKKAEIDRKFDEIVSFAETAKFLDTPVKHFSSGMYVRLAFAVAAHLRPDILLVDEVLSVGDIAFQKKSMDKMGETTRDGGTVLLVSHNMAAIRSLCKNSILLEDGELQAVGESSKVVAQYMHAAAVTSESRRLASGGDSSSPFRFDRVSILRPDGSSTGEIDLLQGLVVSIRYAIQQPLRGLKVGFRLCNANGIAVLGTSDVDVDPIGLLECIRPPGNYVARCVISRQFLRAGSYWIDVWAGLPGIQTLDEHTQVVSCNVVDTGSAEALIGEGSTTVLSPVLDWETSKA